MQMDNTEIAIDYRRAANKQKQIKILAELNQCAERRIAEILAAEGEELPKKWQEQLLKPPRRSWKFPETETEETDCHTGAAAPASNERPDGRPEEDPSTPAAPPLRMTGEAEAVTTAAPEKTATATLETSAWKRAVELKIAQVGISDEELLRAACRMLTSALDLEPEKYHVYSCGVLDLVHALTEEEV